MESGERQLRAFSLIELLVVIAIIGILASLSVPAFKGMKNSNNLAAANRQLVDDLGFARLRAINNRSTVYMVFVSPRIVKENWNQLTPDDRKQLDEIVNGQYTAYALYSPRTLGDQPGPGTRQYLTDWRRLPEGIFINTNHFTLEENESIRQTKTNVFERPFLHVKVPFPTATSKAEVLAPVIAFNYQGQLIQMHHNPSDEYISFTQGNVQFQKEGNKWKLDYAKVNEVPKGNTTNNPYLRVDWLTGRVRSVQPL